MVMFWLFCNGICIFVFCWNSYVGIIMVCLYGYVVSIIVGYMVM